MHYVRNKRYHQQYTHSSLYPGAIFSTHYDGECKILGRSIDKSRRGYYVVEFKQSGIIKEAYGSHIKTGAVSDTKFPANEKEREECLLTPKYFGVGYIGIGEHCSIDINTHQRSRTFILWHNMLARCYTMKNGRRYFKGYNDVKVCERWHNFQSFCQDLPAIPNYKKWVEHVGDYELDKDYLHRRLYSPDTVCFIPTSDNARESKLRNAAMKIHKAQYRTLMQQRDLILFDAVKFFREQQEPYEIVRHGNIKVILFTTPYGVVVYYPLTKKIQRECFVTDGNEKVCLKYLTWIKSQWCHRNPNIDAIAVTK